MIPMSPSSVARRATIVLVSEERATALDDRSMQRNAEGHLVTAMTAVKDPDARIETDREQPVLVAGGARFTIEPGDPLRLRGSRLLADLGGGFTTSIMLGTIPKDSPFHGLDPSTSVSTTRVASILRAAAATLVRIGRGDCVPKADGRWMRAMTDACMAIGQVVEPNSPDMTMITSRTPFAPLAIARFGDDVEGRAVPTDEWDPLVRPCFGVGMIHRRYSSEMRFETIVANSPPHDAMEVLRALARFDATKETPWWN